MSLAARGAADDGQTSGRFDESNTSPSKSKPSQSTDDDDSEDGVTNTTGGTKTDSSTPENDDPTDPNSNSGEASNTCDSARDLGAISGDVDAPQRSLPGHRARSGSASAITENDSYPIPDDLKVLLTLVSPEERGTSISSRMSIPMSTRSPAETPTRKFRGLPRVVSDELALAWRPRRTLANNSDDTRTVSIEIRSKGRLHRRLVDLARAGQSLNRT